MDKEMVKLWKYCGSCKQDLGINQFWGDASKFDGLRRRCKECEKLHNRMHPRVLKKSKLEKIKFPLKVKARIAVKRMIRLGKLIKPDSCENCLNVGLKINAHHEDYSKPLEIKWLCTSCHYLVHHPKKNVPKRETVKRLDFALRGKENRNLRRRMRYHEKKVLAELEPVSGISPLLLDSK